MKTKFFFFLLSVAKPSHNTNKDDFCYIPLQDWNESWNDEKLYKKYKLSNEDIAIIDKYAPTKE
jgi:site-specific DNA-methyltransferase (adenine-specific)